MITLNYRDARPIYEQVCDGLRRLIVSGAIADGDKLPSVRALATQLAINPNTIQRAYNELESSGYCCSVPGKGCFAVHTYRAQDDARRLSLEQQLKELLQELRAMGVSEEDIQALCSEMIEVRGLKKTFDGFAALDGADLSVPRGAVYGLVGPNGAGKTTLLRHLTGVYRQDEGSVRFDGEEVWENAGVKARIASIPDDWFYFMQAGLRDMMRFYRGLYPKFDQERFEKLREVFALDEKRPLRRMSKGQQKQAAFWLALCTMPDYLILDEPVDGLDPVMRRQVWSLILQDVAERGTTVLVSSHNLRELEDVCDHVGVMSRGKLLLEHSLSELQDYTVKLQLAFEGAELPALPQEIKVLHHAQTGRVHTLICRGSAEELEQQLAALHPIFIDAVPLSLEEIFIYELGGEDYTIRDIVL